MKIFRWCIIVAMIAAGVVFIVRSDMPQISKYILPLLFAGFLSLYRILRGPTAADRSVATDVLGILVIGICGVFAIFTKKAWYMDIAIAWALQSFIGVLALAKYLEGKNFDD